MSRFGSSFRGRGRGGARLPSVVRQNQDHLLPEHREKTLYIGNLDKRITEYNLIKMFQPFGELLRVQYLWHTTGEQKGTPRGYAFVEYASREQAAGALKAMNGKMILGRTLVVRHQEDRDLKDVDSINFKSVHERRRAELMQLPVSGVKLSTEDKIRAIEEKLYRMEAENARANPSAFDNGDGDGMDYWEPDEEELQTAGSSSSSSSSSAAASAAPTAAVQAAAAALLGSLIPPASSSNSSAGAQAHGSAGSSSGSASSSNGSSNGNGIANATHKLSTPSSDASAAPHSGSNSRDSSVPFELPYADTLPESASSSSSSSASAQQQQHRSSRWPRAGPDKPLLAAGPSQTATAVQHSSASLSLSSDSSANAGAATAGSSGSLLSSASLSTIATAASTAPAAPEKAKPSVLQTSIPIKDDKLGYQKVTVIVRKKAAKADKKAKPP